MRDIRFFERFGDYEAYVREEVFHTPQLRADPFADRLIAFVLDQRAPLFYDVSDRSEHFGFSGTFHFQTLRAYDNPVQGDLFFYHDFTHLLFAYPHDCRTISYERFHELFCEQERLASNESEILIHQRIAGLREQVFGDLRLAIDVVRERGCELPRDPAALVDLRAQLTLDDDFGERLLGDEPEVLRWFRRWRRLTPRWTLERYESQRQIAVPERKWWWLSARDYQQTLTAYQPRRDQRAYERAQLANVAMAYALVGLPEPPRRFTELPEALERLEGRVLLAESASV